MVLLGWVNASMMEEVESHPEALLGFASSAATLPTTAFSFKFPLKTVEKYNTQPNAAQLGMFLGTE